MEIVLKREEVTLFSDIKPGQLFCHSGRLYICTGIGPHGIRLGHGGGTQVFDENIEVRIVKKITVEF